MPRHDGTGLRTTGRIDAVVLGLGNSIFGDDGVGVHAVRRFQSIQPSPCPAFEVGTAAFSAVSLIEDADRILAFDAVAAGAKPGTIHLLRAEDLIQPEKYDSVHEMGLVGILRSLSRLPVETIIVGAEPERIDWGMALSPALESAVPRMVSIAQSIIAAWKTLGGTMKRIDLDAVAGTLRRRLRHA